MPGYEVGRMSLQSSPSSRTRACSRTCSSCLWTYLQGVGLHHRCTRSTTRIRNCVRPLRSDNPLR